jgi:hypothetical protein
MLRVLPALLALLEFTPALKAWPCLGLLRLDPHLLVFLGLLPRRDILVPLRLLFGLLVGETGRSLSPADNCQNVERKKIKASHGQRTIASDSSPSPSLSFSESSSAVPRRPRPSVPLRV